MDDGPGVEDHLVDHVDEVVDEVVDEFDGDVLDRSRWLPHYLPAWSSREATAASYEVADSCLRLRVPVDHPVWLAGEHEPAIRVSGVQSGSWSGPVGGTRGQQPWREGAVVRSEEPLFTGWTPTSGHLAMTARMVLSPRSMAAWWMVGLEDSPERCAEICVVEVFGDAVEPGVSAAVGCGLHAFRDPGTPEDFAAPRVAVDVAAFHTYAVDWTPERAVFLVDGVPVRTCPRPPTYPVQSMVAVFDFPDRSTGDDDHLVPELVVDRFTARGG